MSETMLATIVAAAVVFLLLLVLKLKIQAFLALLIVSMYVGVATGMPMADIIRSMEQGMGSTLGFIATVVGLGAIFGQILESSGGAEALARTLVRSFGKERANWALSLAGFIIAIPVFFDVGFIILVPIAYALARDTKLSVVHFGLPLAAGLAVTHSFIPPTPGPVAVASLIGADLGWVILFGALIGLPTAILAGPVFGRYAGRLVNIPPPEHFLKNLDSTKRDEDLPCFSLVCGIIGVPLLLIISNSIMSLLANRGVIARSFTIEVLGFLGHPFAALTIATLLALYFLGTRRGFTRDQLLDLSSKALGPAGLIILVTGAGGVFKEILVQSTVGEVIARAIADSSMPPIVLAWLLALIVRVTQGSSTVAMITAAGIMGPILAGLGAQGAEFSQPQLALITLAIAAGATTASHVNDSGFWLIGKYLGMNEKQTLQTWTVMETIISVVGFTLALGLSFVV